MNTLLKMSSPSAIPCPDSPRSSSSFALIGLEECSSSGTGSTSDESMSMMSSPSWVEPFSEGAVDVAGVLFFDEERTTKASSKDVWRRN